MRKVPIIYMVSGLGADKDVLSEIKIANYDIRYINWVTPSNEDNIKSYCKKISLQIDITSDFILIGVSFGGVVAQELCSIVSPIKTIIISSVTNSLELPLLYRIIGKLRLNKVIPISILIKSKRFSYLMFGIKSQKGKILLKHALLKTDKKFLKWAIEQLLSYEFNYNYMDLIRIHGNNDRILPYKKDNKICYLIKGGGHLMIIENAVEINTLLSQLLSQNI